VDAAVVVSVEATVVSVEAAVVSVGAAVVSVEAGAVVSLEAGAAALVVVVDPPQPTASTARITRARAAAKHKAALLRDIFR